jgi:hypothetical protein
MNMVKYSVAGVVVNVVVDTAAWASIGGSGGAWHEWDDAED